MDQSTLKAIAEQVTPLVLQTMRGKGKKEVSELNTVTDYSNIYSMPCFYWDRTSGERKTVNLAMAAIVKSLEDAANEELVVIKQQATEAAQSAQSSKESAATAAKAAQDALDETERQVNETFVYLETMQQNEQTRQNNEQTRKDNETTRISNENNRKGAETTRVNAEVQRVNAENARVEAEKKRVGAETKREETFSTSKQAADEATTAALVAATKANTAATNADKQAGRAKEQADNPPRMGENGNWWTWDETQKKYVDSGVLAKGGVLYPTFHIEEDSMVLYMEFEDEVSDKLIKFDEATGEIYLNIA